jgi:hypothetical protein
MERNINFDNTGGMPLSQDLLKRMQTNYDVQLSKLLYIVSENMNGSGILEGVFETSSGVYSDGIVIHKGVLYEFKGGTIPSDEKVDILSSIETETYQDGIAKDTYASYWIEPKQGGSIDFADFLDNRISNLEELKADIISNNTSINNLSSTINAMMASEKTYTATNVCTTGVCGSTTLRVTQIAGVNTYTIGSLVLGNGETTFPYISDLKYRPAKDTTFYVETTALLLKTNGTIKKIDGSDPTGILGFPDIVFISQLS